MCRPPRRLVTINSECCAGFARPLNRRTLATPSLRYAARGFLFYRHTCQLYIVPCSRLLSVFSFFAVVVDQAEEGAHVYTFEIGPRLSFATAWSTNAVAICHASGLTGIERVERSRRCGSSLHHSLLKWPCAPLRPSCSPALARQCRIAFGLDKELSPEQVQRFVASIHDKMTECVYREPLRSFETNVKPEVPTTPTAWMEMEK